MQVHSVGEKIIRDQIDKLKEAHVKPKPTQAFVDPIKEFARASNLESEVRNWLTYPIEERKRRIKEDFSFIPRHRPDPATGYAGETEKDYETRQLERWRALCVIIQEESRAKAGNRSVDVAVGALKQLFYDVDWKAKPLPAPQTAA